MTELVREDVLRELDAAFPADPVVLTLGGTAREMVAVVGRRPGHLVNLDAMGQTIGLGLGLALGLRERPPGERVVVVEGDGSLLMGLSVLTTVGHLKPRNLVVFILDNGVYLATGGQPTAASDVDMTAVALACGWSGAREVRTRGELGQALTWARSHEGPLLVRVHIGLAQRSADYLLDDPAVLAEDFRRWLRASAAGATAAVPPGTRDGPRERAGRARARGRSGRVDEGRSEDPR